MPRQPPSHVKGPEPGEQITHKEAIIASRDQQRPSTGKSSKRYTSYELSHFSPRTLAEESKKINIHNLASARSTAGEGQGSGSSVVNIKDVQGLLGRAAQQEPTESEPLTARSSRVRAQLDLYGRDPINHRDLLEMSHTEKFSVVGPTSPPSQGRRYCADDPDERRLRRYRAKYAWAEYTRDPIHGVAAASSVPGARPQTAQSEAAAAPVTVPSTIKQKTVAKARAEAVALAQSASASSLLRPHMQEPASARDRAHMSRGDIISWVGTLPEDKARETRKKVPSYMKAEKANKSRLRGARPDTPDDERAGLPSTKSSMRVLDPFNDPQDPKRTAHRPPEGKTSTRKPCLHQTAQSLAFAKPQNPITHTEPMDGDEPNRHWQYKPHRKTVANADCLLESQDRDKFAELKRQQSVRIVACAPKDQGVFGDSPVVESRAQGVRTASGKLRADDVFMYRDSGGICPTQRTLQDKRDERCEYETRLAELHLGKSQWDAEGHAIKERFNRPSSVF